MVCFQIVVEEPPGLVVTDITAVYNKSTGKVDATVWIEGTGVGYCRIAWGSVTTKDYPITGAGYYNMSEYLPAGTHNICADML